MKITLGIYLDIDNNQL